MSIWYVEGRNGLYALLPDEDGKIYKLEWQKGWGATWAIKYPVEVITQEKDTITEWRYYD